MDGRRGTNRADRKFRSSYETIQLETTHPRRTTVYPLAKEAIAVSGAAEGRRLVLEA
jgi:hypothetical protein